MDRGIELTRQLQTARAWILAVGLLGFAVDMFVIRVLWNERLSLTWRNHLSLYDAAILACSLVLWWCARYRPVLCCLLALAACWAMQILLAVVSPSMLGQLFVVKALFTVALIRGMQSARRAERLLRELGGVFG